MKVSVIVNGSKRKAIAAGRSFSELGKAEGLDVKLLVTNFRGHGAELAQAVSESCDAMIAVGGDGTINECVNGMMKSAHQPALGLLPYGTANDFCRSTDFDRDIHKLIKKIKSGQTRPCDVGRLKYADFNEYFVNIADAGFGARVVRRIEDYPTWLTSGAKFNLGILRTFLTYQNKEMKVVGDGFEWSDKSVMVVVANAKYFASGLHVAPQAELNSGKFVVLCIGDVGMKDYIAQFPKLKRGEILTHPQMHYFETSWVEISGQGFVEKDGELGGEVPVRAENLPSAIQLID
ncbi:MAG: diacylglycerol kinase family lipid kinase [Flavobacteriales bacterium]|nr:diacylglycerol kinase family lipid kinase [Flavobacteriales bacterium]